MVTKTIKNMLGTAVLLFHKLISKTLLFLDKSLIQLSHVISLHHSYQISFPFFSLHAYVLKCLL